jgi:hypothetical protein
VSGGIVTPTEGTIVDAVVYAGLLDWRTPETMDSCVVYGGKLDGSRDQRAKTLTLLELWNAGQADLAHGAGLITISTKREYGLYTAKVDP